MVPAVATRRETKTITAKIEGPSSIDHLLTMVEASLDGDKAEDIVVIDLAGKTNFADYMVIASGSSQRQIGTMADHLVEKLKTHGLRNVAVEGLSQSDWVLIDAGDFIVHLFRPEVRAFYALERLWGGPPSETGRRTETQVNVAH